MKTALFAVLACCAVASGHDHPAPPPGMRLVATGNFAVSDVYRFDDDGVRCYVNGRGIACLPIELPLQLRCAEQARP